MVMLIFFSEFCGCLLVSAITENFKLVKIYTGKGLIYILISIIYMSPSLGSLQNYSAYALLFVGTISIVCDCSFNSGRKISSKFVQPFPPGTEKVAYIRQDLSVEGDNNDNYRVNTESPLSNNDGLDIKDGREIKINNDMDLDRNDKQEAIIPSNNPYDIPDDF